MKAQAPIESCLARIDSPDRRRTLIQLAVAGKVGQELMMVVMVLARLAGMSVGRGLVEVSGRICSAKQTRTWGVTEKREMSRFFVSCVSRWGTYVEERVWLGKPFEGARPNVGHHRVNERRCSS